MYRPYSMCALFLWYSCIVILSACSDWLKRIQSFTVCSMLLASFLLKPRSANYDKTNRTSWTRLHSVIKHLGTQTRALNHEVKRTAYFWLAFLSHFFHTLITSCSWRWRSKHDVCSTTMWTLPLKSTWINTLHLSDHTFRFPLQENKLSSVITQTVPLDCTHWELSFEWSHL